MKNRFRIPAILLVLFLCLNLLPFGAFANEFDGLPDDPLYKVVLAPGTGSGEEQKYEVYDLASVSADREHAGDCQFYFNESGAVAFNLSGNYCPFAAPSGCVFSGWSPDPSVTTVTNDTTFTAQWTEAPVLRADPEPPTQYTVSVSANPTEGGTAGGGGNYDEGASVTVTAEAAANYHFVNWTVGGEVVSTAASYTFPVTAGCDLVANFETDTTRATQHTVTVSANPATFGSVSGAGSYDEGASVTVTAEAAANYHFVNWTVGGEVVSTAASYTFPVTAGCDLVANFETDTTRATQHTVTASANPTTGGTVSGAGSYDDGASATVTANPETGFRFVNWKESETSETVVSTDNPYSFEVTEDVDLVAIFEADTTPPTQYTVSVSANPTTVGTVSGGGAYAENASATVTAAATAENYQFVNWTVGGEVVSTDASYTFTVTGDRVLVANFVENYLVDVKTPTHGSVTANAARAPEGATVTLTIAPETGFELGSILVQKVNDEPISISNNTFVMPNCNVYVTATFKAAVPISYTVTGGANGSWVKYSGLPYTFTVKRNIADEDTAGLFMGIYIDSYILPINEYTVKAGSVIITIIPAAMQRLSPGWHTFTFVFRDGTAATRVYIWGNSWYPATGDERDTAAWAVLAGVTLVGMGVIAALGCMYWKKQKNKSKD